MFGNCPGNLLETADRVRTSRMFIVRGLFWTALFKRRWRLGDGVGRFAGIASVGCFIEASGLNKSCYQLTEGLFISTGSVSLCPHEVFR